MKYIVYLYSLKVLWQEQKNSCKTPSSTFVVCEVLEKQNQDSLYQATELYKSMLKIIVYEHLGLVLCYFVFSSFSFCSKLGISKENKFQLINPKITIPQEIIGLILVKRLKKCFGESIDLCPIVI